MAGCELTWLYFAQHRVDLLASSGNRYIAAWVETTACWWVHTGFAHCFQRAHRRVVISGEHPEDILLGVA
jgi:hypothetical protein